MQRGNQRRYPYTKSVYPELDTEKPVNKLILALLASISTFLTPHYQPTPSSP